MRSPWLTQEGWMFQFCDFLDGGQAYGSQQVAPSAATREGNQA